MDVLRGNDMKGIKDKIYKLGVILFFLAIAGVAEGITGRGDTYISIGLMIVGFLMALWGGYL